MNQSDRKPNAVRIVAPVTPTEPFEPSITKFRTRRPADLTVMIRSWRYVPMKGHRTSMLATVMFLVQTLAPLAMAPSWGRPWPRGKPDCRRHSGSVRRAELRERRSVPP
jgi:hypothetical protein